MPIQYIAGADNQFLAIIHVFYVIPWLSFQETFIFTCIQSGLLPLRKHADDAVFNHPFCMHTSLVIHTQIQIQLMNYSSDVLSSSSIAWSLENPYFSSNIKHKAFWSAV